MWCSHCQQEVPSLASVHATGEQRCPKCQGSLLRQRATPVGASKKENAALTLSLVGMPVNLDDWELEDDLRATKRILALARTGSSAVPPLGSEPPRSAPAPNAQPPRTSSPVPHAAPRPTRPAPRAPASGPVAVEPSSPKSGLAWAAIAVGLMAFVCGGVLVTWSFASDRPDLWKLGLPIAFAGQAGLILGLIFLMDGLWHSTRQTTQALEEIDDELDDLKHAATLLSTTHSSPAQSFYSHFASGASPQLLLADLKGQLDLLATRLANEHRAA